MTARPMDEGEDAAQAQEFVISTILPGFLFLGPEIVLSEQARQLEERGVKRILNIAIECDDDQGLNLRQRFERYMRIPMRDTVEEANVSRRMREVCDFLGACLLRYRRCGVDGLFCFVADPSVHFVDDARLHSSPTYVHCKAGKSRSVTAIMAYLIHANHWTLSRAYAFVLDRRKGISPNIGFVSELMGFEEEELGGKSIGVVGNGAAGGASQKNGNYGYAIGGRRAGHMRESMPPAVQTDRGTHDPLMRGQVSAGPLGISDSDMMMLRDVGEEMEIRDASGRYRHARRAPVDEYTLQPTRRVSKAGLESAWGE
jgi:Dual specificity phosphatase, catalytic domain